MIRHLILFALLLLPLMGMAQPFRVVYIGDSITDGGWGRSGGSMASAEERNQKDLNHLYGHSFMLFVATHFESEYPASDLAFYNRGISGYTLDDLHARWECDVLALQPDLLSILIGTNDVDRALRKGERLDLAAWKASYRALLDRTRAAFPSVRLVLCTPFVAQTGRLAKQPNYPLRAEDVAAAAAVVERLAEAYGATLVPFDRLFAELLALPTAGEHWIWDGIHPTAAGHKRMADCWIRYAGTAVATQHSK